MSSLYVRDKVTEWAKSSTVSIPFYQTINEHTNPLDNIWFTAEFEPEYSEKITFCGETAEEGLVTFVFSTQAGVGYEDVIAAGELAVAKILEQDDPTRDLTLELAYAPDEYTGGSADNGYRISISVEYYHRR